MLRLFASFLGALTVSLYANANSQEIVIIENVNVIPMTSEVVLKNQSVVVKNGKVESICPAAAKECNVEGARVIAADSKYLIPGLSDMHAHINPGDIGENELLSEKDKQAAQGVLDQM
jgi:Imidazolonepropionase and related amidohydrolases